MNRTGEVITMNFTLVEAAFIDIAQTAPDFGGIAQRLVKILQVKDGGAFVRGDKFESRRADHAWQRHNLAPSF